MDASTAVKGQRRPTRRATGSGRARARMASCRASSDGRSCSTTATDGSAASRRVPSPASTVENVWRFSRLTIPPRLLSCRRCHRRSATPPGISSGLTAASAHGAPPASTSWPGSAGTASPQPPRGSSGRSTLFTNSSPAIGTGSVHSSPTARRLAGFLEAGRGRASWQRTCASPFGDLARGIRGQDRSLLAPGLLFLL